MITSITKDVDASVEVSLDEFDDADIIEYIEGELGKVVLDPLDVKEADDDDHPRNYIDTREELREHLIKVLGLGHYVTNYDIITKVAEILQ